MKAVILAGGLGSRLAEETDARPKPLVEIGGRPILWHIMKIYDAAGITDFVICAGYKASMEVFAEHEAKSPEFKKIHQDMRAFQRDQILWSRFSEYRYDSYMATLKA